MEIVSKVMVTKYDPKNRDSSGSYLVNEWTSYSDIGRTFDNILLTRQKYKEIEDKYINAIYKLINFSGSIKVKITKLEKTSDINDFVRKQDDTLFQTYSKIKDLDDIDVDKEMLLEVLLLIIREYMWCNLQIDNDIKITFGYDYYMYFSGVNLNSKILEDIKRTGLFVEDISRV